MKKIAFAFSFICIGFVSTLYFTTKPSPPILYSHECLAQNKLGSCIDYFDPAN